ncbi:IS30 family transposase [Pseudoalteromonas sp. OANN1]|uniref:IS30 family transposase n=1 Tax=Pseudoalteromonas sp. OANN1 TaxID=2954497 RepID=UPI002097792D|nr:IS30 family transposase [Pseudoalteromonas sp. OANN1]MCO7201899.1 IS30 family transposase [Pseudoalteromonas sp. OANN1]
MRYQQLTEGRRYQISILLEEGFSATEIAKKVKCHRSTVYRELRRHKVKEAYCPYSAHVMAMGKRKAAQKYRIPQKRIGFIRILLQEGWSPEQVSAVLTSVEQPVSHEWIYRYIALDKRNGGKLYQHLRQGHKRYRRGRKDKGPAILNATSIDERPEVVEGRTRLGDWEIDTVLGKQGTGALVTVLERKTRFYLVKKAPSKSAEDVAQATIELLAPYKNHVHTITADNGREFAAHELVSATLETEFYFAHPYCSWERGANENANGLLRQYIKKGTDLREISDADVEFAMSRINYRPRKCLSFKQPAVVFKEMTQAA